MVDLVDNGEQWRPVKVIPNYEVSNLGRVRRLRKDRRVAPFKILKPVFKPTGICAPRVNLKSPQRNKIARICDLVAEAFLGPRPSRSLLRYIDSDVTNNAASNLEYAALERRKCNFCGTDADVRYYGITKKVQYKSKYCSSDCAQRGFRSALANAAKGRTELDLVCEACGGVYRRRHVKIKNRFCSRRCFQLSTKSCLRCHIQFKAERSGPRSEFCSLTCANVVERECKRCGTKFTAHKRVIYCSRGCRRRTGQASCGSSPRRAKYFGAPRQYFAKVKVFERDKWRCQLCGVKTPKRLKGKHRANSPELDHIIPLSVGGGHVWENVQCACRRCNGKKSNKPMGQQWLMGLAQPIQKANNINQLPRRGHFLGKLPPRDRTLVENTRTQI